MSKSLARNSASTIIQPSSTWASLDLREIWEFRELCYFFVWRDIRVRYKQTVIGAGWAVLQPFATMLIFTVFFGMLARLPSEGLPYPIFYFSALLPWMYFSSALTNATNVMVEFQRVITRVYFPRIFLPLSVVLSGLLDFGIGFVVLLGMMLFYDIELSLAIISLPFFLLLAVATAFGVGLWLSALNALYRDVRYTVPFLVQLWMFASPVVYPSSLVPERWQWVYGLNPLAGVIEGFRWAVTGQGQPSVLLLMTSTSAVLLVIVGGLHYFQKMESTIADVV